MQVAVDGHGLAAFPTLDGGDIAFQVGRDFLPGIETVGDGSIRVGGVGDWFRHR